MAGGNGDASGRPEISFRSSCGEGEHSREESTRRQKGEEAELADLFPLPAQQAVWSNLSRHFERRAGDGVAAAQRRFRFRRLPPHTAFAQFQPARMIVPAQRSR